MKIRELAEYCNSIVIDCDKCENKAQCEEMGNILQNISPIGLVAFVDGNIELD